jgi:hypothetical protein
LQTKDTILSIEPSYLDTSLVLTRKSKNIFEVIKVSTDTINKKIIPLVMTRGIVFYAMPSNYIKNLTFYIVWYNNRYNICQYYNKKVDTLYHCSKMINQLEVINESTIIFSYENEIIIYPLTGKPTVLFNAGKSSIYGFTSDNAGGLYVSIDEGIVKIDNKKQQSFISTKQVKGKLRFFNDELFVLDSDNMNLILIHTRSSNNNSNNKLKETLTNASIINMVNEKLSDELIIKIIKRSKADFNLNVNSIIALTNQNVSSAVIAAMESAMENNSTQGDP